MNETGTSKKTLTRVAALAGVGTATVDRVLNERGGVSASTAARVLAAAKEMGLRRILPTPHQRTLRILALMARPDLPLVDRMNLEFQRLGRTIDKSVVIHRRILEDDRPPTFAAAIRATDCDAVIVYAPDDPEVVAAIDEADARGVKVCTILSDIPTSRRLVYAGIDHKAAGETAAFFAHSMLPKGGGVLVLAGFPSVTCHIERAEGLAGYLKRVESRLQVRDIVFGQDDRTLSESVLRRGLRKYPDTACIYNVGAANLAVEAVIRSLPADRRPMFIGYELTVNTRRLLKTGLMTLAIDQNCEQQLRYALEKILLHFGVIDEPSTAPPPDGPPTPFSLYAPTNIGA